MDEARLEAIVSTQIELAKSHDRQEREGDRAKALDYYLGHMDKYVPPEPNRSKVVSRDVADTIGWMLPGIMRVYTASDRMAEAEPVDEQDIQFAKQATDGLNYVFWKDNRGYEIVYSATWDALLVGNGVIKTYYDDTPVYSVSFHSGLSEDQVALLLNPEDGEPPEVLAQSEEIVTVIDEMGQAVEGRSIDLKIKRKKAAGKFVIEAVAPEKFLIDQDAITTDDAAFTAHWERKTRSDLVEMGYDKAKIWEIPQAGRNQTPEEQARQALQSVNEPDKAVELVDYYECFIRIDIDDDGEAELVRACFAGSESGKLLDWEVWEDENPFDDIPCEPIPHRWTARSISDETMDVQDVKTVLTRQGMNNLYASNNPQRHVSGKVENPDELINPSFGGVVFSGQGTVITDLVVPFVANHAFEAIAYQDEVIQRRTGVGRPSMALDPEALQNQSATANQNQKDAAYSQVELVARNMAEWGWKKVFRKLLRLMIKHQDKPRRIMLNGKPVAIDPRFWNADMDVTINVGLGTGSRDRDLVMLGRILETQIALADRFVASGAIGDAIDMLPKIIRTMTKMAESAGIRNPEDFYPDYTQEKVAQLKQMAAERAKQPDPKVQAEKEKAQVQAQIDIGKATVDAQLEREKMERDAQLKREQMAGEIELKREQLAAELQLKRELAMAEMEMKREAGFYKVDSDAEIARHAASSQVHMGGEAG